MIDRQFLPVHPHTHAFVLRRDHQRLLAHAPDHVERLLRFAMPRQQFHVGRHTLFDCRALLLLNQEEAVGRTKSVETLVWSPVIVVLHPPGETIPCLVKRIETRLDEELILERLPEPLNLAQRLGMMRRAANVMHVIPCHFLLEGRLPAPTGILPAIVGQHLTGGAIFADRPAVDFQYALRCVAAVDTQSHNVSGIVVQEGDDVRHLPEDVVVRDVALP